MLGFFPFLKQVPLVKKVAEAASPFDTLVDRKTAEEIIHTNVIHKLVMYPNFLIYSVVLDMKSISTLFG